MVANLDKPILTESELYHFLHFEQGITSVTRSSIRWAVRRRQIQPTRIGRGHFFTKRDGLDWIESRRLAGKYEPPALRVPTADQN
jgi:hypothetical protein